MINSTSLRVVDASTARFGRGFRKPLYDSYCFSNIPQSIRSFFSVSERCALPDDVFGTYQKRYRNVVLIFIDGFGWNFFERHRNLPFLNRFHEGSGIASKLTAQFPSTTAAQVTTMLTGLDVGESGVFEWFYYEPSLDAMVTPIPYALAKEGVPGSLEQEDVPEDFFPHTSLFDNLTRDGVESYMYQSENYAFSPYSMLVGKGVTHRKPYGSAAGGIQQLADDIAHAQKPSHFYAYFDLVDAASHRFGPDSKECAAAIAEICEALETHLYRPLSHADASDTLLLITADHGQTAMDPGRTIHLDRALPQLKQWIRTNRAGDLLAPGGSHRDQFLYIKEEHLREAMSTLADFLKGKAEVRAVSELVKDGFFGDKVTARLTERLGNVCILPYENESVWWSGDGHYEKAFLGHHGGLTYNEMDIPLLVGDFKN